MNTKRAFIIADFQQPSEGEPIRSVITESPDVVVVAWHVKPGQRIAAHVHPAGQDTWTILSGSGQYIMDTSGTTRPIGPGMVLVAHRNEIYGVLNDGNETLEFVSVVAPATAGYELA